MVVEPRPRTHELLDRAPVWLQRTAHILQRLTTRIAIGMLLVLSSHFGRDEAERAWMRDTGSAIVGISFARWLSTQGRKRYGPSGEPLRHQTLRISREDVDRIQEELEKKGRKP